MRASVLTNQQFYLLAGAVLLVGWAIYRKGGDALELVNPTNRDNVFNQAFNGLYGTVTGSDGTLGTDLADEVERGSFDPTSRNNVANHNVVSAYQWLTGSSGTPGTDLADWAHGGE